MKRIGAVVAAAGFGRRYGTGRKLDAVLDGRPLLVWTLQLLGALPLAARVVVLAPGDEAGATHARATGVAVTVNPHPSAGLGASIATGVAALPETLEGILVLLGDMPRVQPATCLALFEAFAQAGPTAAVVPVHRGERGHPVLFGAGHRNALAALTGDTGARSVLASAALLTVEVADPGILLDVDTPADLARLGAPRSR